MPKALVPLGGRPYKADMVDTLMAADLVGVVLSMGYVPNPIRRYYSDGRNLGRFSMEYVVEK